MNMSLLSIAKDPENVWMLRLAYGGLCRTLDLNLIYIINYLQNYEQ